MGSSKCHLKLDNFSSSSKILLELYRLSVSIALGNPYFSIRCFSKKVRSRYRPLSTHAPKGCGCADRLWKPSKWDKKSMFLYLIAKDLVHLKKLISTTIKYSSLRCSCPRISSTTRWEVLTKMRSILSMLYLNWPDKYWTITAKEIKLMTNLLSFCGFSEILLLIWLIKMGRIFKRRIILSNLWKIRREVQMRLRIKTKSEECWNISSRRETASPLLDLSNLKMIFKIWCVYLMAASDLNLWSKSPNFGIKF